MATELLGPTSISSNHVQEAFREYVKDDQLKLLKADGEIIAAGQGFTSYIMRLKLTWHDEDKKRHRLPDSTILKALSKDSIEKLFQSFKLDENTNVESGRTDFTQMLVQGHKTECLLYELFGHRNAEPPVPVPRAYGTWIGDNSRPPMILLEDLGDRATVLGDGSASLNYAQLRSIAEAQANLHAWCLTTKESWRDKFETMEDRMQMYMAFKPMMEQGLHRAKQAYPEAFGNLDDKKLMALFEPEKMLEFANRHKPIMRDILVHGDFWANNIMFNKLPDGSMGNDIVALIDWQLSLQGNPMMDFGRILSMSADAHLRIDHLEDLIKHYYETLIKKLGPDHVPKGLTYDYMFKMAEEQTALNCMMLFFMQDTMQAIFAPVDGPDSEVKRERMIKRTKDSFEYASKILDITKSDQ